MKQTILLFNFIWIFSFGLLSQIQTPVSWTFEKKELNKNEINLIFKAKIDSPWHLYGTDIPEGGPVSTKVVFEEKNGVELIGKLTPSIKAKEMFDENFSMTLSFFEKGVNFTQKIKLKEQENFSIAGYVEYMVCDDQTCLAPTKEYFSFRNEKKIAEQKQTTKTATTKITQEKAQDTTPVIVVNKIEKTALDDYWTPVIDQLSNNTKETKQDYWFWLFVFIKGFLGGLIAIFTPCVWPIIPMTVSFFLKRTKDKQKGKKDALLYGTSIIVIYLILGIFITLIFGANALNNLSTSAFFNLLFFGLLVLFGASFLGAFELTLPSSWTTKLDQKAEATSGVLSIFLMAFTLALVSFSCTGPIIGTLLVDVSVSGSLLAPAIGMFGFALALSGPFTLFALFPSWLQNVPKSGGWLNVVKVSLGFLELAFALKFFSVADLAYGWGILDREVFLVIWIVLFFMLGLYLIGKLSFAHDSEVKHISVTRLGLSIASFAFAIYMIPGLWGAPLKGISAFAPPLYTQDFNLYKDEVSSDFHNFEEGMEMAKKLNKPALVDFSGYGCVNCRKMEANIWSKPEIKKHITQDFVLITLYVDDKTPLAEPYQVTENGKTTHIKTIGDKWSYLQRYKFGANAQPYYVILDKQGFPLTQPFYFTENAEEFSQFIKSGLKNYK